MYRRSRIARGALTGLAAAWLLASPAGMVPAQAQSSWPFQLEWEHTGARASHYELCVNSGCSVLNDARNTQGSVWRASLPLLPPGEYRLVVRACGAATCLPGQPELMIRVVQPSPRRPPVDVLEGPRIPVSR